MTRLFHYCKCIKCEEMTQVANINVNKDICKEFVCSYCKFKELLDKGIIEVNHKELIG